MPYEINTKNLLFTERGKKWLEQFNPLDEETAERMINNLTLVSHSEFYRAIQKLIEKEINETEGFSALYAVRELDPSRNFFEQACDKDGKVQALSSGNNHGSEAIVANLIRNLCDSHTKDILNHPNIGQLRDKKCRKIIFIDDLIGSGNRARDFLKAFWAHPSITSWHSLKYVNFSIIAYSCTDVGKKRLKHKANPVIIHERPCPSFMDMPWSQKCKTEMRSFFEKYGEKTCKRKLALGYKSTMASTVFEHGCPNNTPAILWAPDNQEFPWYPLFPNGKVMNKQSAFPEEIFHRDARLTLLEAGQRKLSLSGSLYQRGVEGERILLVLALIAQRQRKKTTLSFATGLNELQCTDILSKCVSWGFITQTKRLTKTGYKELQEAKKCRKKTKLKFPKRGEDYYYPKLLRSAT